MALPNFLQQQDALYCTFRTYLKTTLVPLSDKFQRPRKFGPLQAVLTMQAAHFCGAAAGGQSWENALDDIGTDFGSHFGWGQARQISRQAFHAAVRKITETHLLKIQDDLHAVRVNMSPSSALSRLHGVRFLHVDGTKIRVPHSDELVKLFGVQTNGPDASSHYPLVYLIVVTEAGTNRVITHQLARCKRAVVDASAGLPVYERAAWKKLQPIIGENDCIIADCGFASYAEFCELQNQKKYFMMGIPKSWKLAQQFRARKKSNDTMTFTVPENARCGDVGGRTMTLRLFTIRDDTGAVRYIATNLPEKFTLADCRKLYKTRWAIEVVFRMAKEYLGIRQLRSRTYIGVRLELLAIMHFMHCASTLQTHTAQTTNDKVTVVATVEKGFRKAKMIPVMKATWRCIIRAIVPCSPAIAQADLERFRSLRKRMQRYVPKRKYPRISKSPDGLFRIKRPSQSQRKALKNKLLSA